MRKLVVGLFALLLASSPAMAGPLEADWYITNSGGLNFHFTMSVNQVGANYAVQFSAANEGTVAAYYRGFGVKHLFDDDLSGVGTNWFSASHVTATGTTALTQFKGGLNVKTSQNDYCMDGKNGFDGMVCSELIVSGTDVRVATGQAVLFNFLVTGADPYTDFWHLQTKVYRSPTDNAGLGSISLDAHPEGPPPPPPPAPVPEPGTLALFSAGIAAGIAKVRARRTRIKL